ncbi:MAG TPA: YCF48-related protein [Burkholderiaceae bacterium]|jgi:photosystem II stability/assembly factor-like uncharacterized protein|nr:YCF48-related protein [Burkholderiaceae bacterium]
MTVRRWLAAVLASSCLAARAAQPALPAALTEPALASPKAPGAATLAVARAGARLVAVGERGTVLCSDDGGRHWRQAEVPVQSALTAVRFVDERTGWAVGHLGVILRTEDGGRRWTLQWDGVRAAAALMAAAGTDERLRRDAQRMVDDGPDKPFFDVDATDPLHAVAVGAYGLAFATNDSGRHWTPLPSAAANPHGLHLYAVRLVGDRVFIAGEQGLLLRSSDGGASFTALPSPYKGSFFGLLATRSGALLAYGLRGSAYRSADGGEHWDKLDLGTAATLQAGYEPAPDEIVLMTQAGALLASRDDGRSFGSLKSPAGALPAAGLAAAPDGAWVLASLRGTRRAAP